MRNLFLLACGVFAVAAEPESMDQAQSFVKQYCVNCHLDKSPAGGFSLTTKGALKSIHENPRTWNRMIARVRDGEMPPKNAPLPSQDLREKFVSTVELTL